MKSLINGSTTLTIKVLVVLVLILFSHGALAGISIDKIVAIVNDKAITQSDINRVLGALEAEYGSLYSDPQEATEKLKSIKENIVNQMVDEKLVLSEAERYEIKADESAIEARIEKIREGFFSEEDLQAALLAQGLTLGDLRERFRDQEIMKTAVDYFIRSKIKVDPIEIKQFYQAHQEELLHPERAKVLTILIRVGESGSERQALQAAKKVLTRLRKGEELEEESSLGFVERGELIAEIDQAIFGLEPGECSNPIKTEQGYRIFKIEEKEPARPLDFREAQDVIRDILYAEEFARGFRKWMDELKKDAYISIK